MKLRYLLLPLALFPMASLFGANASANAAATPAANAAATPEADTKTTSAAADVKLSAATTAAGLPNFPGFLDQPGLYNLRVAEWLFERWINEHRCQPTWTDEHGHLRLTECHPMNTPDYLRNPGQDGCNDGRHCSDNCIAERRKVSYCKPCTHMIQKAVDNFKIAHRVMILTDGRYMPDDITGDAGNYRITPLPQEAARKITQAVPAILPDLAVIMAQYLPELIIEPTMNDKRKLEKHACTYYLDSDRLVIRRRTYYRYDHRHTSYDRWSGSPLVVVREEDGEGNPIAADGTPLPKQ